jgi:N-acetylneuraminic acid mutarotase
MDWFRRVSGISGLLPACKPIDPPRNDSGRCVVELLETRELLAADCALESATPEDSSSGLSLMAVNDREAKPATPTKLSAQAKSSSSIRVRWQDTEGEKRFELYRQEEGAKWVLVDKLKRNKTKFNDKGLDAETTYEYRVRAVGKGGVSAFSEGVSATTKKVKPPPDPDPDPEPTPGGDLELTWVPAASAPVGRHEAIGIAAQGKLYAFGGFTPNLSQRSDVWSFDPVANKWQQLANLPEPMTHGSAALDGDKIYVAGFFEGADHFGDGSQNVWVYDISENKWSPGPRLPTRQGAAVLVKAGRNLHFFGGVVPGRGANSKDHWVWNLDRGTEWTRAAAMPNPKDHLSAVELGGKIYAIGGEHLSNDITNNQSDVHVYDPKTNAWKKLASLPIPWSHHTSSTVVVDGKIVVLAGETNGRIHLKRVMQYDPQADKWSELNGLPATRKSPIAGVVGDMIVVYSGEGRGPEATTWIARIRRSS